MKLVYKAVTKQAKIVTGVVDAKDETEVAKYLRMHEYHPISITAEKEDILKDLLMRCFVKIKAIDVLDGHTDSFFRDHHRS